MDRQNCLLRRGILYRCQIVACDASVVACIKHLKACDGQVASNRQSREGEVGDTNPGAVDSLPVLQPQNIRDWETPDSAAENSLLPNNPSIALRTGRYHGWNCKVCRYDIDKY